MNLPGHQVCLLLGSNIDPEKNLPRGVELLRQKVGILRSSSVWQSPSVGSAGPDFLNMALLATTSCEPEDLKEKVLRPVEAELGRRRSADKNAPRPFDADIILFDGQLIDETLFHYVHRAVPVSELMPDYRSPEGKTLVDIAADLTKTNPIQKYG
jgi:2-amino-4-hydroxy-6-hydroxymethyldihydropteridine diphosphokinase